MESPVGTLAWARATGGQLTAAERRRLLRPVLKSTVRYAASRIRLALGIRPARPATLALEGLRWPDSALARRAEQACRETLTLPTVNHSYRTFVYGLALAGLDGVGVDTEELYVTALLHDIALEDPVAGRCFACRGAERAEALAIEAGAPPDVAARVAEGVALHTTPGLGFEHGPLGPLIAAGALVDLLGLRLDEVDPGLVMATAVRYPRAGGNQHVATCWRAESAAVPTGRAALIERWAMFSTFVRFAPGQTAARA